MQRRQSNFLYFQVNYVFLYAIIRKLLVDSRERNNKKSHFASKCRHHILALLTGFVEKPFKFIFGFSKVLLRRFLNECQCLHINSTALKWKIFTSVFQKRENYLIILPGTPQGRCCLPRSCWGPWDSASGDQTPRGLDPDIRKHFSHCQ